jgi:LacI family transcriptional regulator
VATITDVAREAGVSIATVSRVFNDSDLVSPETRRRVRDVATRLNYWPNAAARSLITSRTHTLGVLLPELHGEFFSSVILGIDRAARQEGFHLLVSSSHADTRELLSALRTMRGRIDGLIVMAPDVDAPAAIRHSAGTTPIVLLDPEGEVEGYDTLSIANFEGAYALTRHLLGHGHRRIATITGPEGNADARERLGGYRAALRDSEIALAPELEVRGDFTEPSGYAAVREVLALDPRPTAIFASNDYMAVGAMRALAKAGVPVPAQISVAGFDDIEMTRYLSPPLTTVRVDTFHLGERAVHLLLRATRAASAGEAERHLHEVLPTSLVVRASSGPLPAGSEPEGRGRDRDPNRRKLPRTVHATPEFRRTRS